MSRIATRKKENEKGKREEKLLSREKISEKKTVPMDGVATRLTVAHCQLGMAH